MALAALPQSDGKTKLRQEIVGFDEVISTSATDFLASGLKSPSVIRLGFLASIPENNISGEIGWVAEERQQRLLGRLAGFLEPSQSS